MHTHTRRTGKRLPVLRSRGKNESALIILLDKKLMKEGKKTRQKVQEWRGGEGINGKEKDGRNERQRERRREIGRILW